MYKAKTAPTDHNVIAYLETVESEKRKEDAYKLLDFFEKVTGKAATMWGTSIIGFGSYHYVYASGHSGDAPLVGFSPRKKAMSLYFATGDEKRKELLEKLGKHTSGVACVYVKKLEDIHMNVLEELILQSIVFLNETYPDQ